MVKPNQIADLERFMAKENITSKIVVKDVETAINAEMKKNTKLQRNGRRLPTNQFDYSKFNTWQDVCFIYSFYFIYYYLSRIIKNGPVSVAKHLQRKPMVIAARGYPHHCNQ